MGQSKSDMSRVPEWMIRYVTKLDLRHAAGLGTVYELVGRN